MGHTVDIQELIILNMTILQPLLRLKIIAVKDCLVVNVDSEKMKSSLMGLFRRQGYKMTSDGRINNSITAVKEQIERYFNDKLPNEACGLVVKKPDNLYHFVKCNNQAEKVRDNFIISPEDFLAASKIGEVAFVVHSHPHAPATPSQADRVACERSGLPWWIVSVPYKKWGFCFPKGYKAPLIGRVFCHGILDCYSLIS